MFTNSTFTFVNNTWLDKDQTELAYQDNQIHVILYAKDFETGAQWYFDQDGEAHEVSSASESQVPNFLFSEMTAVAGQEHTYQMTLPLTLGGHNGIDSARMYFSMGTDVIAPIVGGNLVQAPTSGDSYFDFVEFTFNKDLDPAEPGNLNIDITNVDSFGLPLIVDVDGAKIGAATYRADIISQYKTFTQGTPFEQGVWPTDGAHGPYSIQSPKDVLDAVIPVTGLVSSFGFLQNHISAASTTIKVSSGLPFPTTPGFTVELSGKDDQQNIVTEIMTVTQMTNNPDGTATWTVTRGEPSYGWNAQQLITLKSGEPISADQTTVSLTGTSNFPTTYPFYIQVDAEIMKVTGVNKNNPGGIVTWNVERGQFGTASVAHANSTTIVYSEVTSNALNSYFDSSINALFSKYYESGSDKLTIVSTAIPSETNTYEGYTTQDANGNWVLRCNRSRPGLKNWPSRGGRFWRHQGYVAATDHCRAIARLAA